MDTQRGSAENLLTMEDLAGRGEIRLGESIVNPARRIISGPGGSTVVEPRVMQVLVVLADAAGEVVTRETLFRRCWGDVYVGEDSLNRAIAALRKVAAEIASGGFEVETITRTGYRLTPRTHSAAADADETGGSTGLSRRTLVGSGVAAATVLGGAGFWWVNRPRSDPRFGALMEQGENALRLDEPVAAEYFEQAAAIEPRNAKAWGLLAFSRASDGTGGELTDPTAQAAERAARKALEIDQREANALLALTMLQSGIRGGMLDWYSREERFRGILAIDPGNPRVMLSLTNLLAGVGRWRESLAVLDRALAIAPLAPNYWARKAIRLWGLGEVTSAVRVIERAIQLWPSHFTVRLARLMIFAFTGRTRAALAIVEEEETNPISPASGPASVMRTSLAALETPTPSAIAAARKANIEGSNGNPQVAAWAMVVLSELGELDSAFEVANGLLLDRGSIVVRPRTDLGSPRDTGAGWRNTFGLFTPPAKSMRLDRRFKPLADDLGLTDYWRRRGIGPDQILFKA